MDSEAREKYVEAGETAKKAKKKARELAEPGTRLKTIADEVEALIRNEGFKPAFPVNLSPNQEAAHYSPGRDTERKLAESDVLKIDVGVQNDGFIADTAITVNPSGERQEMIETNKKVLEKALNFLEPGKTVGELGTFIHNQVPDEYQVVRNLTGHYLDRYTQHAGVSIPNIRSKSNHVFEEGDAVAIEPFLSTGSGKIKEGKKGNIYKLESDRNVRGRQERQLLKKIESFQGLPFSIRWFDSLSAREKMALKKLVQNGAVKHYPILRDAEDAVVSQMEHTVLVGVDDGENVVTTR